MKKVISLMLVVLLMSTALAGCATKETATPEKKKLVFTSRLWSAPEEKEFIINEIIKPYEEANNIDIEFSIATDDEIFDAIKVQQESGNITTDIITAHSGKMPDWTRAGYVMDLTDVVKSWKDRTFFETFKSSTHKDGKQYFLPVGADVYLTLINKKALKYKPEGVDIDHLTWEDYAKWAVNIAKGEGEGKVVITGIPQKSWIYMFGASALSYGAGFPDINSPEAMKAWKIWEKIGDAKGFIPTVANVESSVDPMKREEGWLCVFHNARVGTVYASNETKYIVAPAPSGPKGIGTVAGVSGYAIVKGSKNYEEAVKFLEYLTRPDIQTKIALGTGGFIPPVKEAIEQLGDGAEDEVIKKALMVLEKGVPSGVPAHEYKDWGAVKQIFDDIFVEAINGDKKITQEYLDAKQAQLDALKK
ncbi:ABC transporter substrate-binding protein [Caloranaerobacter ferrireducens]|uniref:ABC transporter substrate-binding protein n=1 Tax=Caloranaerobacter ferrireducens TaxID=1323370 RepID=UPI00084DF987|nr:extracellular solute-binding protein [Caloranaerobacter ferrireducens]